jgi:hypothetical protein
MKVKIVEDRKILTSDKDMILTNRESFVTTVIMPADADISVWQEITEAEAQEIIARMEAESDV